MVVLTIMTVAVAFGGGWLLRQTTSLRGTLPKPDGNHAEVPITQCSRWHRRISPDLTFMRRYAPDESNATSFPERESSPVLNE
jgi:hypothetical protein